MPAGSKNVDLLFASLEIPRDLKGAILLPFLKENVRIFWGMSIDQTSNAVPRTQGKSPRRTENIGKCISKFTLHGPRGRGRVMGSVFYKDEGVFLLVP